MPYLTCGPSGLDNKCESSYELRNTVLEWNCSHFKDDETKA